jgi:prevent-host-death family protein
MTTSRSPAELEETSMPTSRARLDFGDLLNRAAYGKERIVLTRRGRALVAVIPLEDLERLRALEDRRDAELLREALADPERIPYDQVRRELDLVR